MKTNDQFMPIQCFNLLNSFKKHQLKHLVSETDKLECDICSVSVHIYCISDISKSLFNESYSSLK